LKAPIDTPTFTGTATAAALTVTGALLVGTTNVVSALGEKATTVNLDLKAPKANPAFSGTATAAALTVTGALLVGTTNVVNALGEKATTTALDLKAPKESPALTGTATAANLTVSGALLVGTTNVLNALGEKATTTALDLKANASDVFTKAQLEDKVQLKISAFNAPLKYTANSLTGFNSLSIDPTVFQPVMPWASCLIITNSAGTVFEYSYGFQTITPANITRVGTGNKAYNITFPTPHPNGSLFAVMVSPYSSGSNNASWDYTLNTDYFCTTAASGSTGLSVWCRRPGVSNATGIIHGSFYVYTVP
jgi:hypothetical protein